MGGIRFFTDDAELISGLIGREWSLGPGENPVIVYKPESYFVQSRIGSIYVYPVSYPNSIASTDYRSVQRIGYVGIKMSVRDRDRMYAWGEELYRILLENRRSPILRRNGYTFLEITSDKPTPDLSGWYSWTFDIKLTGYHRPVVSDGFGGLRQCPLPSAECTCDANDPGECDGEDISGSADDEPADPGECEKEDIAGSVGDEPTDPCD